MIRLIREGTYTLIATTGNTKILNLDERKMFAWVNAADIGEILVISHKAHKADHILSTGRYRMYEVKDEPKLTDLIHLELLVGDGVWQGYVLPNGLPTDKKKGCRIIPTNELVTTSAH